jgi:hypothetical protein
MSGRKESGYPVERGLEKAATPRHPMISTAASNDPRVNRTTNPAITAAADSANVIQDA